MNKEYENISFFLTACTQYGIDKNDLFQVKIDFLECNDDSSECKWRRR